MRKEDDHKVLEFDPSKKKKSKKMIEVKPIPNYPLGSLVCPKCKIILSARAEVHYIPETLLPTIIWECKEHGVVVYESIYDLPETI